ncbi:ubiquitin-40S ribosomal protein S27a, putative [Plasmodium ovale wallikeri]|uniref:Ubiquitin-40S ribosomal protein S27a, putative n=2 Tax=Plasmodium ovale TaxID=36330 RepID=A0A1A8ZTH9_PLAOA|nr:ubiquitin-40S ribosomal protein S27a, putative [Plasmodium ovale wallikeri]SBT56694.1 ubiquitin-40S ribosomal protein S27a, putative [Plasmodium ovale wallikeri]SBT79040.1 ubiquitin-40S ribosomal protein S27a, putative [Plasmodium ovale]
MKIFINIPYDDSLCIESSNVNTIKNVKEQISELKGIPCEVQKLYKNGRPLEDEELIEIDESDIAYTINLNFGLLGGGKKKKKKVYKKPKKEKHKKKKVKLAVLKFYKVGDDGKVFRLKRQCDNCAPGTLMASHFDRDYCGRCHLTIMKK